MKRKGSCCQSKLHESMACSSQKSTSLGHCSVVTFLEFSVTLSLNLCIVSEAQWPIGHAHEQRTGMQCVCPPFLMPYSQVAMQTSRAQKANGLPDTGAQWDTKPTEGERVIYLMEYVKVLAAQNHVLCLNQNLLKAQKQGKAIQRNT